MSDVKVKPLVWEINQDNMHEGNNKKRRYHARARHSFGSYFIMEKDGVFSFKDSRDRDSESEFGSAEIAMRAVQSEFDRAILSHIDQPQG